MTYLEMMEQAKKNHEELVKITNAIELYLLNMRANNRNVDEQLELIWKAQDILKEADEQ